MEPKPTAAARRWPDRRPETLRVEEVAQILGIGRTKTYDLIKQGVILTLKLGGARRVSRQGVDRMLAEGVVAK